MMLHINYHPGPEKAPRMRAAIQYFMHDQADALKPFGDQQYDAHLP